MNRDLLVHADQQSWSQGHGAPYFCFAWACVTLAEMLTTNRKREPHMSALIGELTKALPPVYSQMHVLHRGCIAMHPDL
jgi:hypothetical protein